MSSYLQKWGHRVQGTAPSLSPRLPSLFESTGGFPTTPAEPQPGITHEPPPVTSLAPANLAPASGASSATASPATFPNTPQPVSVPHPSPRHPEASLTPPSFPTPPRPPSARSPAPSEHSPKPNATSPLQDHSRPILSPLPDPPGAVSPQATEDDPNNGQTAEARSTRDGDVSSLRTELERLQQWIQSPDDPAESGKDTPVRASSVRDGSDPRRNVPATLPSAIRMPATASPPAASAPLAPPPQPVHVHIDTIILRATSPTPARTRPTTPPPDRVANLHQYLARRNARRT
jgi:hypothetical protein